MKRSVVALGILGLIYALARPAAAQTVLQKFDMSDDSILKDSQTYVQGFGSNISNDSTLKPWYVLNGWLTNDDPSGATTGADGSGQIDAIDGAIKFELLTGDKTWTDYSFQVRMHSGAQNTGGAGIIVRAQPKTKPSDPDTYYELHYITANSTEGTGNTTDETILPDEAKSGIAPSDDVPALRLEKVVNNKYSILAETSFSKTTNHIPEVNAAGPDNENGAIFRVVVKGSLIQVFTSLDGTTFQKWFEVTDTASDAIKGGLVGVSNWDYDALWKDWLVTTAP
jgi:hypothetical protein